MGNSFECSVSGEHRVSAARDGDVQEAKALLECNPRLARYSTFGVRNSPLHYFAAQGHHEVSCLFKLLICADYGIDIYCIKATIPGRTDKATIFAQKQVIPDMMKIKARYNILLLKEAYGWAIPFETKHKFKQSVVLCCWVMIMSIHTRSARRLEELCFKNGGIYIKLGQHIGIFGTSRLHQYIEGMLNRCPTSSYDQVCQVVKNELGDPPEEYLTIIFEEFDLVPIASASLAQLLVLCYLMEISTVELIVNTLHRLFLSFDY
ncbi:LOW QUALITY PROTEIN: hypothetical protein M8C21_018338, partial [Ambrosia artemisiifolia]